jgi:hypothetical protein
MHQAHVLSLECAACYLCFNANELEDVANLANTFSERLLGFTGRRKV